MKVIAGCAILSRIRSFSRHCRYGSTLNCLENCFEASPSQTILLSRSHNVHIMWVERLEDLAKRADLDPEFAKKFLAFIIDEVIRHHIAHKEQSG